MRAVGRYLSYVLGGTGGVRHLLAFLVAEEESSKLALHVGCLHASSVANTTSTVSHGELDSILRLLLSMPSQPASHEVLSKAAS